MTEQSSETDRAWAAGFYDGEGWTGLAWRRGGKTGYPSFRMMLAQSKDYESVHRFHRITGVGRLYGPYQPKGNRSPQLYWAAHGEEAVTALSLLLPYLGEMKAQQAVLAKIQWALRAELRK